MSEFELWNTVPIPVTKVKTKGIKGLNIFGLQLLEVGGYGVLIPYTYYGKSKWNAVQNIQCNAYDFGKRNGKRFTTRQIEEGVGVWRVE